MVHFAIPPIVKSEVNKNGNQTGEHCHLQFRVAWRWSIKSAECESMAIVLRVSNSERLDIPLILSN